MCKLCKIVAGVGLAVCLFTGDAFADPLTGKQAKKLLVKPKGAVVEVLPHDFVSENDAQVLIAVGAQQKFYGAIAMAPDEGLASEATVAGADFHSLEPAKAFALKACDAARKGGAACVIAALIRPKGWKETGFQLSMDASVAFKKSFLRSSKPRVFAISQSTGKYAIAKGNGSEEAAIQACGAEDCEIAISD